MQLCIRHFCSLNFPITQFPTSLITCKTKEKISNQNKDDKKTNLSRNSRRKTQPNFFQTNVQVSYISFSSDVNIPANDVIVWILVFWAFLI